MVWVKQLLCTWHRKGQNLYLVPGALSALIHWLPSWFGTTVISPGAVATERPNTVTDPAVAERINKLYEEIAIPADSFARVVAFALSQPEDVDVNEILLRPTLHAY